MLSLEAVQALDLLRAHAGQVVLTALALATIGALESSLNMRAIDLLLNNRHDPRHELLALGCSNMVCGLIGGLPMSATRTRALATLQAGGRGRVAALTGPAVLLLLPLVGGPWLAVLPMPVLAGVMLVVGLGLADRWTARLLARMWAGDRSHDLALGLALGLGVMVLVIVTTLWKGMAVGVGLGMLLSLLAFAARINRSPVRDRYLASAWPSRRIHLAPVEARLRPLRAGITVLELDGALFFGTSDRLLDDIDALPAGCRFLVLDLRRVAAIDESGAMALQQATARLRGAGHRHRTGGPVGIVRGRAGPAGAGLAPASLAGCRPRHGRGAAGCVDAAGRAGRWRCRPAHRPHASPPPGGRRVAVCRR
jgi:SulP family sulfate permease